ncbi:hypothetical protein BDF21DRAFT_413415 [Thamnidium elegans]|uniref:RING-type E3 ubiquitin transferase n=1 Tax=Thamnidium elegans TaxID=101142 RepID=A0A8H7SWJ9_9FUNG|nr:hypothetical protein INT48_002682 [Thamnidium elegans]KAI8088516.1 hypothetical protein BDF21DRAFT_413415 [Thamnidium elegans]
MGQSPSTTASRHDNASTRTLHSTSMISNRNSNRPLSFFRRISNRLSSTHPTRRFGQNRATGPTYTSGSSTTSSVRRATQEAARAAAAVTGPPALPSFFMQTPTQSSRNSITSATESIWNELITSPVFRENTNTDNPFLRYLQVPLRLQQEVNTTTADDMPPPPPPPPPQSSSASSTTTARRMHILVIEYRSSPNNNNNNNNNSAAVNINDSLPSYRFLGLRRPRSEVSTSSSTDTIQSMPLSVNSNQPIQESGGQWMVYVLNNQHSFQALSSSLLLEDNPSYEDLLWLSNMLGTVRPNTTTQAAVDEAIPVTDWSQDLKDESCLVCLDEFVLKQPVRILKCQHVFHRECVDRWLCEAHNSCPVCRGVPVEN